MFGFPVAPRPSGFQLQQNLLRTVVFQIKFPPIADVVARQAELQAALQEDFPRIQEVKYQDVSVAFVDQTPIVSAQQSNTEALEFQSEDQQMIFSVKNDELSLTILGTRYLNFEAVQQDLQRSIYRVAQLFGLTTLTRTAIRKINLINFQSGQQPFSTEAIYRSVFNNFLTLSAAAVPAAPYMLSGISNYRYHHGTHRLNLVYGLLPEPAADGARQFVLDIDLANTASTQSYEEVTADFAALNAEVFNVFSWSINQSLVELLNSTPPTAEFPSAVK